MLLEEVPLLLWLSFCNEFASARCLALWRWLPESTRGWVGAPTLRLSPATHPWGHLVSPPGTCARVAGQWQSPRGMGTSPRGLLTPRRRQMGTMARGQLWVVIIWEMILNGFGEIPLSRHSWAEADPLRKGKLGFPLTIIIPCRLVNPGIRLPQKRGLIRNL